jgi:hypothetical protein
MGGIRRYGKPPRGEIHWDAGLPEYRIHSHALNASTSSNGSLRSCDGGHVWLRVKSHAGASGSVLVWLIYMKLVPWSLQILGLSFDVLLRERLN